MNGVCGLDGCKYVGRLQRGYCEAHYARLRKHGDPGPPILKRRYKHPDPDDPTCVVDGCGRVRKCNGYCGMHYTRTRVHGAPGDAQPLRIDKEVRQASAYLRSCTLDGCSRDHYSRGYCNLHWRRWKETGDPGPTESKRRPRRERTINQWGYVLVYEDGGKRPVAEHRVIMKEQLGRDLLPGETVHHRNGVRHDNRVENLELRSGYHPRGAAVKDHIEWAWAIIRRYDHPELMRLF